MITKEELKKEVDNLPENLVEEAYTLLKRIIKQRKGGSVKNNWAIWKNSLSKFTPDFMIDRDWV